MPAALPLVEDMPGEVPSSWGAGIGGNIEGGGAQLAAAVSAGPQENSNNTHLWVAGLILLALAGVVFLHISGFRFATDVGITKG
jgi:hypothetical protein